MSVLIKNMEMPQNCCDCFMDKFKCLMGKSEMPVERMARGRHPKCPLVSVPPHGDFIDRKAAYDSILNGMAMTGYQSRALDCVNEFYVPTIIEAEEEDE